LEKSFENKGGKIFCRVFFVGKILEIQMITSPGFFFYGNFILEKKRKKINRENFFVQKSFLENADNSES